jgi:adenine-specific DNA-methyltransferase
MTFRYIGSKARILSQITAELGPPPSDGGRFVDLFCGTGAVAEAAARLGWRVHVNDHLHCAVIMAAARMLGQNNVRFSFVGGYQGAVDELNDLQGERGFFYREYSPVSRARIGLERRYFTSANASRIDAMRGKIRLWKSEGRITDCEERLLLADLMSAANRVANIAGTYGCFLSKWQAQAMAPIKLRARDLVTGSTHVTLSVQEATMVRTRPEDVVYLDPPYTKRQYAAYYHILETIALGDEPRVEGVAGIRPWRAKASDFCYRARALRAFEELIGRIKARRVLISYSDNAHIPVETLSNGILHFGRIKPILLTQIGRYRPNQAASAGRTTVNEYLIELKKAAVRAAA